jgi:glycosyltransferase involved in cell wall biosynthesis
MKILIPNHFPLEGSGSGIYTQNVGLELTRLGHEVLVIAPDHAPLSGFPFPTRTITFANGENTDTDLPFNFPCFTTHPKSNATYYELTDEQRQQYIDAYQHAIDEAVAEFKPDIIHVQHLWVATYCAAQTDVPYVATVHGTDLMGFENDERYHDIARAGVAGARRLIAISDQIYDKVIALYDLPESKVVTILNGFNTEIFRVIDGVTKADIMKEFNAPETDHLISFVGKLTDFKGVDVLIKAAAVYEKELGAATFITGMGQLRDELGKLVTDLGLEHVHFLGHQPQPTVARINNAADLCAFPSRIEPFGLVAIEALACGTPVVTTNQGGFPDFINDKVGVLVDVDAPDQLADAIISQVRENAKATKGPYAAQYAAEDFSWKQKVGDFYNLYEEVLNT